MQITAEDAERMHAEVRKDLARETLGALWNSLRHTNGALRLKTILLDS
jgi:hypothetical protein